MLPESVAVTILADRGFGDTKLFAFLDQLGFAYVIRFRGNIHVTAADGEKVRAARGSLRHERAPCRAGDAPVQDEHERRVECDIDGIRDDSYQQRRPGVLQAAQHASAGQHGQHRRRPEQADPQVDDRLLAHRRGTSECGDYPRGKRPARRE